MKIFKSKKEKRKEKLFQLISEHKYFLLLFAFAALIRVIYLWGNTVPFLFDHGKDSLAILHMLVVPKLKFIGPWTSIPGLYFGPAWYYLLAPFYLVSGFNPASAAVAMSLLVLFQMYLVYRYFNLESAAIVGFSGFWLILSKSAWNPYPMTFLTILILIILLQQIRTKETDPGKYFYLSLIASFGFHFSSAFAIFYPVIILATTLIYRLKISLKTIFYALLGFTLPFVPQIFFELKNNFPQTQAILKYFSEGGGEGFSVEKILTVLEVTFGEFRILSFEMNEYAEVGLFLFLFLLIYSAIFIAAKRRQDKEFLDLIYVSSIFLAIPIIGFFFLHFNVWYVYPMVPVVTILIGSIIAKAPRWASQIFIVTFLITGLWRAGYYLQVERQKFLSDSSFYPVKRDVIDFIRQDSNDRDFSVYTYKPDIYDFPYQYEFLVQGLRGEELPLDFAYEPGVPNYVREKIDILEVIDKKHGERWRGEPRRIYYIVTDTRESEQLDNWWARQSYEEITSHKDFGDRLTVYVALPKQN